ncbi:lipopolysaccharide biosynthesis protein [Alterisphingorhabdus coralli]|uniref:Polysaccharide biosynthesis protein n=1 Tax=Alterisphingorhabdus coralli TaxID=3071408 RepID=A0AA97F824_9SPHN|nr:hypothetical protein [Parasphingorhabdus sp. SCSIO 66989]WOE75703.1 hypothetical protein RB602_03045 [Parasphingorhabdus sp. SCSIO 66989]
MSEPKNSTEAVSGSGISRGDVGKGAAMAALARLGALIEVVAQPAYVWLYGLAGYGLYISLWSAVNVLGFIFNLAMHQALQRLIPGTDDEEEAHAILRFALLVTVLPACAVAILITALAPIIAPAISSSEEASSALPQIIALFSWSLPLLILLEVATAAARARRAFGPEIRLRIFWEQCVRLALAVAAWFAGFLVFGLFIAHIASLAVTAVLALRLIGKYYDWGLLMRAPGPKGMAGNVLLTGMAMLPPNIARRAFNDLPPVLLNLTLPGAGGAIAAGLYGIARKVASVPLIVRQAFLYVLAPLSAAQAKVDRAAILPLYQFSNRLAAILVIPLTLAMILIGDIILLIFTKDALAALPILVVLLIGRAGEALLGAATPIVEMTGHRLLPLVNSLLGLLVAAITYMLLPENSGAVGMAVAVALGVTAASWIAAWELSQFDKMPVWDRHMVWAVAQQLAGCAMLAFVARIVEQESIAIRLGIVIGGLLLLVWVGLKWGLESHDKAALGRASKILHL